MKFVLGWWLVLLGSMNGIIGQSQLVTYEFKNTSLSQVLEELKEQTQVDFAYDHFASSQISITHKAQKISLDQALTAILASTDYHFLWVGQTCVVAKHLKEPKLEPQNYHDLLSTITVGGRIIDSESNESLPFVTIHNIHTQQSGMSDAYGKFQFSFLMAHPSDTIAFQFVGYESKKMLLSQLTGTKLNAEIEMVPRRLYLPAILVTAGSNPMFERDADHGHLVFNPNDLVTTDGLGEADVFRTIQLLPGVSANQENNGGLLIRGANADQTMLQLDGFTIYHQDHLFGMFSAVNAHAIKNVRLHKTSPHSRHGGRIGGLVEMVGKEGNTRKGITQINLGALSGSLSVEGPLDSAGKIGFIFNGRRAFTDGWYSPTYQRIFKTIYNGALVSNDPNRPDIFDGQSAPNYYFQDANVKLTWKISPKQTLNASVYTSRDQLFIRYADTLVYDAILDPKMKYTDDSQWNNTGASLHYVYHAQPNAYLMARLTVSKYDAAYFSTDTILRINQLVSTRIQNIETDLENVKLTVEKQWTTRYHQIALGGESEHVISTRRLTYLANDSMSKPTTTWWHSLYVQDNWSPSLRWRVHSGLRLVHDQRTQRLLPEPRLTLVYRWPLQRLRIELSYARLHQLIHRLRQQNMYQNTPDYWALSNGTTIPILASDQLNFAAQRDFKKGHIHLDIFARINTGSSLFRGSLPGYDQSDIDNLNNEVITGTSQSHGLEASGFYQYRNHQMLLAYNWLSSSGSYPSIDNQQIIASSEHRHEIKAYYEWQSKHWSYSAFWTFGSGRPYTPYKGTYQFTLPNGENSVHFIYGNFNSKRLPPYHRLDLSVKYKWSRQKTEWELGLSLYNVYNRINIRSRPYFLYLNNPTPNVLFNDQYMLGRIPSFQMQIRF